MAAFARKHSPSRYRVASLVCAAAVAALPHALCPDAALAQPNSRSSQIFGPEPEAPPPELIESLVAGLDDESYTQRERSFVALAELRSLNLKSIEAILDRRDLTSEQRARLVVLARERFVTSPRAAMGVQFYTNVSGGAGVEAASSYVAIENLVPGFRSAEVLRPGDVILEVAGFRISGPLSRDMVRAHIISRDPGDTLPMVIRRGAERMEVSVTLGSYLDLAQGSPIYPHDMARSWWARMGRRAGEHGSIRVENAELPARSAWPSAVWVAEEAARQARAVRLTGRSSPQILGAGASGQSQEPDPGEQAFGDGMGGMVGAAWANQGQIIRQGNVIVVDRRRGFAQPDGWLDFNVPPARTLEQELRRLDEDEKIARDRLAQIPEQPPNPNERVQIIDTFGFNSRQRLERTLTVIPIIREALIAEMRESEQDAQHQERGADAMIQTDDRRGG